MQTKLISQTTENKVKDRKYTVACGKCGKEKIVGYKYFKSIFPTKVKQKSSGWCVACKNTKGNKGSFRKGMSPWNKGNNKQPFWRAIKNSLEWVQMRQKVFQRDNYTCQICLKRGGELHPDHIVPKALDISKVFDLSNIRTLCASCHRKTPSYGRKLKGNYKRPL